MLCLKAHKRWGGEENNCEQGSHKNNGSCFLNMAAADIR